MKLFALLEARTKQKPINREFPSAPITRKKGDLAWYMNSFFDRVKHRPNYRENSNDPLKGEGSWDVQLELTDDYIRAAYNIIYNFLREKQEEKLRENPRLRNWKNADLQSIAIDLVYLLKNDSYGHDKGEGFDKRNEFGYEGIASYFTGKIHNRGYSYENSYFAGSSKIKGPNVKLNVSQRELEAELNSHTMPTKYRRTSTELFFVPKPEYAILDKNGDHVKNVTIIMDHKGNIIDMEYRRGNFEGHITPAALKKELKIYKAHTP